MREKKYLEIEDTSVFYTFYYIHFEITVILVYGNQSNQRTKKERQLLQLLKKLAWDWIIKYPVVEGLNFVFSKWI